jgi:NAD(P) transhydrogenase subunit beta
MPILNADQARTVMVLKRSLRPGFAGEDNELFYEQKTMMVFGDAKATLTALNQLLKQVKASVGRNLAPQPPIQEAIPAVSAPSHGKP